MTLADLVGSEIQILSKWFSSPDEPAKHWSVVLRGVDAGGILIESNDLNEAVLQRHQTTMLDRTPLIFLPYHRIDAIAAEVPKTVFSKKVVE